MGIVYEGEQQHPQRAVAVKVIRGGQFVDEYRVRLFQREAQTLARLRHPGIADIYDAGFTADGQHYFAMEMVEGLPLTEYVRTHKLARPAVLDLFQRICEAINYAHQRGVIHRDLKPTNILIDNEGRPKILDFGLARLDDPDEAGSVTVTADGHIVGTPALHEPGRGPRQPGRDRRAQRRLCAGRDSVPGGDRRSALPREQAQPAGGGADHLRGAPPPAPLPRADR